MRIIAHRGASAYAPENTLEAFRLAIAMGSKDFEFDIHRTKDGVLVVNHNYYVIDSLEKKRHIAKLYFADLRKIDVAHYFIGADFHCVPSVDEVLEEIGGKAELLNFEIKNDGNIYPGIEEQLLKAIRSHGLFKKALISSFDYGTLARMRSASPDIAIGLLVRPLGSLMVAHSLKKAEALKAENLHISYKNASSKNISMIREAGLRCFVYTVNDRKTAERIKSAGADGIFSNFPDIMGNWELKP